MQSVALLVAVDLVDHAHGHRLPGGVHGAREPEFHRATGGVADLVVEELVVPLVRVLGVVPRPAVVRLGAVPQGLTAHPSRQRRAVLPGVLLPAPDRIRQDVAGGKVAQALAAAQTTVADQQLAGGAASSSRVALAYPVSSRRREEFELQYLVEFNQLLRTAIDKFLDVHAHARRLFYARVDAVIPEHGQQKEAAHEAFEAALSAVSAQVGLIIDRDIRKPGDRPHPVPDPPRRTDAGERPPGPTGTGTSSQPLVRAAGATRPGDLRRLVPGVATQRAEQPG
ncbi:hypothetical protein [Streptomyces sp. NPDC002619]|uniref:hypothetical protein n=1 Tax=Streptomyces sp. NPDC002619 TaxID=3364655 RepID=UPI00369A789B